MKKFLLGLSDMSVSEIGLGCWRLAELSVSGAEALLAAALESGVNFFDHADIYKDGACESLFAKAMAGLSVKREDIYIQSKCGIVRRDKGNYYNSARDHIMVAVKGSLKRLGVEYLDALLLHRPDALMDPAEVADAFDRLHAAGLVRNFGVSNMRPGQMALLSRYFKRPLVANQLELSLTNSSMIDAGIAANMEIDQALDRDGGVLDYCRLNDITVQAWSPFQYGVFEGTFLDNPKFPELNAMLDELATTHGVAKSAVAVAWLLRHPARIQVLVGTTQPARVKEICKGSSLALSRPEWYDLFRSAGNMVP